MNNRTFSVTILVFLFVFADLLAQSTFTSTGSGDWDDGGTWGNTSPGTQGTDWPGTTDNATISSGQTVTLTGAETINDLTIDNGGVLNDDNKGIAKPPPLKKLRSKNLRHLFSNINHLKYW